MSSSVPGTVQLPSSKYDLDTYMGRVKHCAEVSDPRMLLTTDKQLEESKALISDYRTGKLTIPTPAFWLAKQRLDSTLHPDNGEKSSYHSECHAVSSPTCLFVLV